MELAGQEKRFPTKRNVLLVRRQRLIQTRDRRMIVIHMYSWRRRRKRWRERRGEKEG
jgi:hypothetical protein